MNQTAPGTEDAWRQLLARLGDEVARLDPEERGWLSNRLDAVADCQRQLHGFFLQAGGPQLCCSCEGLCCGCGRNHLTLVNLLGYLVTGESVPEPDFNRPCPFLAEAGCLHDVGRRPFNCVTFLCEAVEERLGAADREAFYAVERHLRRLYADFDRRYAASSLRGIFIRAESLGARPFLSRPEAV